MSTRIGALYSVKYLNILIYNILYIQGNSIYLFIYLLISKSKFEQVASD